MSTENTNSLNAFNGGKQGKDKHFKAQMKRVYKAFSETPKTMLQVSNETNVRRANICRYVGKWKKADKIGVAFLGVCPVSKKKGVQFLTTDPDLYLKPKTVK